MDESERDIIAVFIPADINTPIQEIKIHQDAGNAIMCFIDHCKRYFSQVSLQQDQAQVFRKSVQAQHKDTAISDQIMNQIISNTTIDMVVLHPPKKDNGFISINMYVDDKGVAKQLPPNLRASSICQACGVPTQIMGDAFIGKQFDDEEGFNRFDFHSSDLASDAAWVLAAKALNTKSAQRIQQTITNKTISTGTSNDAAIRYKESGNEYFKQQDYPRAIDEYTQALKQLNPELLKTENTNQVVHALFSNRSACYLLIGDVEAALNDSIACTTVRPKWFKGWGRLADAQIERGEKDAAMVSLTKAIELCPSKDVKAELEDRLKKLSIQ